MTVFGYRADYGNICYFIVDVFDPYNNIFNFNFKPLS